MTDAPTMTLRDVLHIMIRCGEGAATKLEVLAAVDAGNWYADLIDRLPKMLPDPVKLRAIAEWLDTCFQDERSKEWQADLRRWADAAEAAAKGAT